MKRLLLLFLFSSITLFTSAQIVDIPDANFKNALLNHDPVIDTNDDGDIQVSEAEAFAFLMNVSEQNISDLTGIEAFVNLTQLRCSNNQLTELDVSQNTLLNILFCGGNQLIELDISQNILLTTLFCDGNQLTELDVTNNPSLYQLNLDNNNISQLNVYNNLDLTILSMRDNNFTNIDVSQAESLGVFSISLNNISQLDISQNENLGALHVDNNLLVILNIANGNNENFFLYAIDNPNLSCIQVDADIVDNIPEDYWQYDEGVEFSVECPPLNVEEHILNNVLLYPNPASAYITLTNLPLNSTLSIFNIQGKQIYNQTAGHTLSTISVAEFERGVYFVRVVDGQKNMTAKKLIVR